MTGWELERGEEAGGKAPGGKAPGGVEVWRLGGGFTQWSKWGGGGSGGVKPPSNVQESVQILEIWKQMCQF